MKTHVLLLFVILACAGLNASDADKQTELELVKQAAAKTNLLSLPGFELKATARLESQGKLVDGTYHLLWNGSDQWREETKFPGFSEIQVGGKGRVWIVRSTDSVPLRILQLRSTFRFSSSANPRPDETVKKVRERKINGKQLHCVEVAGKEKYARDFCIDEGSGTVVGQENLEFDKLEPIGPKLFPRVMKWKERGQTLIEVHVQELKLVEPAPPSLFEPPANAISRTGCMDPLGGHLLTRVSPNYPSFDRQARRQGTVHLYVLLGADGAPKTVRVISTVSPSLDASAADAIKHWRYEPATCDGVPVEVETSIQVGFTLQ